MSVATQPLRYQDEDVSLTGLLAWDSARHDRRPGLMVVHGGAGLDDHAREQAQRLAGLGFMVLACDMFGDGVAGDRQRVQARIMELRADPERLCRRGQAGLTALASRPEVDGRLAAIGFCFGGMAVLALARAGADLLGVISVHGSLETPRPAGPGSIKAKVLVCHGALDPHVPQAQVIAFMEEMNRAGADWQLMTYGGAVHGFTHKDAARFRHPGVAYHALSAARSFAATRTFLGELVGG